jgi:hypothetical protein
VLAQGARTFGFGTAVPSFAGHELCSADPYVQGPGDPAPLHPTASGELAIALADQQALPAVEGQVPAPASSTSAGTGGAQTETARAVRLSSVPVAKRSRHPASRSGSRRSPVLDNAPSAGMISPP